jgi:hypothetical protein
VSGHGLTTGDQLFLWSVDLTPPTEAIPDGTRIVASAGDANTFSIDLDDVGVAPSAFTSFSYGTQKKTTLYASIPSEINSTDFLYQIYRTQSESADIVPEQRYKILDEKKITSTELANGFISYEDQLPEELVVGNAELYTNPTQEGEAQANARPPLSQDIALFKNYIFFAANTQYRSLAIALVAPQNAADGDTITIAGAVYEFYGDVANTTVGNKLITSPVTTTSYVEVTQVGHGFVANDYVNVISQTGLTGLTAGEYVISAVPTPDTFLIATGITGTGTLT